MIGWIGDWTNLYRMWTFSILVSLFLLLELFFPGRTGPLTLNVNRRWAFNFSMYLLSVFLSRMMVPRGIHLFFYNLGFRPFDVFGRVSEFGGDWLVLLSGILALDLALFFIHWLEHKSRFLWSFHSIHHSDPMVDVSTNFRHHPGEFLIGGLILGILFISLGLPSWVLSAYGLGEVFFGSFHHCNLKLRPIWLEMTLSKVITTPFVHQIHHSNDVRNYDMNFGNIFTVWDRLFKTFQRVDRTFHETMSFGLNENEDHALQKKWKKTTIPLALGCSVFLVLGNSPEYILKGFVPNQKRVDRVLRVQPIQVCQSGGAPCVSLRDLPVLEMETDRIFRRAGIEFQFLAVVTLNDSRFYEPSIHRIKEYPEGSPTDEVHKLVRTPGHRQHHDPEVINLFLVSGLKPNMGETPDGLGLINSNGVVVAMDQLRGSKDILAHELGHNLGLDHHEDSHNLMKHAGRSGLNFLSQLQIEKIKQPLFSVKGARLEISETLLQSPDARTWSFTLVSATPAKSSVRSLKLRYVEAASLKKQTFQPKISGCQAIQELIFFEGGGGEVKYQFPSGCFTVGNDFFVNILSGYVKPLSWEYTLGEGSASGTF